MYQNTNDKRPPHEILASHIQKQPMDPYYNPYRQDSASYQNYNQPVNQPQMNPVHPYQTNNAYQNNPYQNNFYNQNSGNRGYEPTNPYPNRIQNQTYPYEQRYNEVERFEDGGGSNFYQNYRGQVEDEDYGSREQNDLYGNSRKGFIQKVYTILCIQLLVTAGICLWAMNSETFKHLFMNTPAIIIISVLLIAISLVIGCCWEAVRPYGLPVLIIFTLIFGLFVGIACAASKAQVVATAAIATLVLVVGLTIYACVTKTDFTTCGPYLFVFCLIMFVFGIALIFWNNEKAHLVYACLSALLFSWYLIFDTQLVLGKGQFSYSLDDAYLAAIQLYIDIIQLFLQLLRILSIADG